MQLPFNKKDLPEVVVKREATEEYPYTEVTVGGWSFCVEEDIEEGFGWKDVKSILAYTLYLEEFKKKQ